VGPAIEVVITSPLLLYGSATVNQHKLHQCESVMPRHTQKKLFFDAMQQTEEFAVPNRSVFAPPNIPPCGKVKGMEPLSFSSRCSAGVFCGQPTRCKPQPMEIVMGNLLHYALVFLVVALVAAAVGFGGVAGFAMDAARLLFWVFIVLFVISLVAGLARRA
jgi:uncharacterized membrane protein YtjA (UPF0391 family)